MSEKFPLEKAENGQSFIEFAITLSFMLILLCGVVDLGRAFFAYIAIRDAAQEGAVYASLNPIDTNGIEARVRTSSQNPVDMTDQTNVQVAIAYDGPACAGNGVKVSVTYNFEITTPLMGMITGSQNFPMSATVVDTILRPPCTP